MRKAQYTVSGKDVQEHAEGLIQKHLGLSDFSKKCQASTLLQVLFAATARLTSIFAACLHLKDAPSCETLRKALLATLPEYAELQRGVEMTREQDDEKAGQIEAWLEQLMLTGQVLAMDAAVCRAWARLMHRRSEALVEDAFIAATARAHRLVVVTRNVRDFKTLGVDTLNPFERR